MGVPWLHAPSVSASSSIIREVQIDDFVALVRNSIERTVDRDGVIVVQVPEHQDGAVFPEGPLDSGHRIESRSNPEWLASSSSWQLTIVLLPGKKAVNGESYPWNVGCSGRRTRSESRSARSRSVIALDQEIS